MPRWLWMCIIVVVVVACTRIFFSHPDGQGEVCTKGTDRTLQGSRLLGRDGDMTAPPPPMPPQVCPCETYQVSDDSGFLDAGAIGMYHRLGQHPAPMTGRPDLRPFDVFHNKETGAYLYFWAAGLDWNIGYDVCSFSRSCFRVLAHGSKDENAGCPTSNGDVWYTYSSTYQAWRPLHRFQLSCPSPPAQPPTAPPSLPSPPVRPSPTCPPPSPPRLPPFPPPSIFKSATVIAVVNVGAMLALCVLLYGVWALCRRKFHPSAATPRALPAVGRPVRVAAGFPIIPEGGTSDGQHDGQMEAYGPARPIPPPDGVLLGVPVAGRQVAEVPNAVRGVPVTAASSVSAVLHNVNLDLDLNSTGNLDLNLNLSSSRVAAALSAGVVLPERATGEETFELGMELPPFSRSPSTRSPSSRSRVWSSGGLRSFESHVA